MRMSRKYAVVDADGHVLEPGDLWMNYVDARFREDAPRVIVDTDGRNRVRLPGKGPGAPLRPPVPRPAGMHVDDIAKIKNYTDGRKGGFEPHARIKDMDLD